MNLKLKASDGWWQDVSRLISRSLGIYEKAEKDPIQVTAARVKEHREWLVSEAELMPAIKDLGFLYVPKKLFPGPMFLFPELDTEGKMRAQTRPLHSVFGDSKYYSIGTAQEDFLGPIWLGNSENTLDLIAKNRFVVLVEGPFDLLACRTLAPNIPVMSSLTKNIGKRHQEYLRILGVKNIVLMFDNDKPHEGEEKGAGAKAMDALKHYIKTMTVTPLVCPASDPSDCLKSLAKKAALKSILEHQE